MRKRWLVAGLAFLELLVFVIIVAILWGWGWRFGGTNSRFTHRSRSDFSAETEVRVHTLNVRPAMDVVDLHLQAKVQAGSMVCKVIDPDGVIRWEERASSSKGLNESRSFEPVAGEWMLEITLEDASGHYNVQWTGSN